MKVNYFLILLFFLSHGLFSDWQLDGAPDHVNQFLRDKHIDNPQDLFHFIENSTSDLFPQYLFTTLNAVEYFAVHSEQLRTLPFIERGVLENCVISFARLISRFTGYNTVALSSRLSILRRMLTLSQVIAIRVVAAQADIIMRMPQGHPDYFIASVLNQHAIDLATQGNAQVPPYFFAAALRYSNRNPFMLGIINFELAHFYINGPGRHSAPLRHYILGYLQNAIHYSTIADNQTTLGHARSLLAYFNPPASAPVTAHNDTASASDDGTGESNLGQNDISLITVNAADARVRAAAIKPLTGGIFTGDFAKPGGSIW